MPKKPIKYVPLKQRDGRTCVDPYDFYMNLNTGDICKWWCAKLTGFDVSRRRYSWSHRTQRQTKTYRREFLDKIDVGITYWLDFGKTVVGDLLETEENQFARVRDYFKIVSITSVEMLLQPMTKRSMTIALQKLVAPKPMAKVVVRKGDAARFYKEVSDSSTFEEKFTSMAQVIAWLTAALKQTIAQRKHKSDIEKKLRKIKKLRLRAGHETTPEPERLSCLTVAIRMMEGCIFPDFLPMANIDHAIAGNLPKEPVHTAPPPQPRTATANVGGPAVSASGVYAHAPEVLPIGEALLDLLGLDFSYMKVSKVRVTIKHPKYNSGSKPLFTMFSKSKTVQFMCPLFDQLGVTEEDRLGMPLVHLLKPVNVNLIDEAKDWAKKVEALL